LYITLNYSKIYKFYPALEGTRLVVLLSLLPRLPRHEYRQVPGCHGGLENEPKSVRVVRVDRRREPGFLAGSFAFRHKSRHGAPLAKVAVASVLAWFILLLVIGL